MLRVIFLILLWGLGPPWIASRACAQDEDCADYVSDFARGLETIDPLVLSAIYGNQILFSDVVFNRSMRLQGSTSQIQKTGPDAFFDPKVVADPRDWQQSLSRFYSIAIQRELDSIGFGAYAARDFRDQINGKSASPGLVVIFWPEAEKIDALLHHLERSRELKGLPRLLIVSDAHPSSPKLEPQITRMIHYEGGPYPDFADLKVRPQSNSAYPVYVLGGPCAQSMGNFFGGLLRPVLDEYPLEVLEIYFHVDFAYVNEQLPKGRIHRTPVATYLSSLPAVPRFCRPFVPQLGTFLNPPECNLEFGSYPNYHFERDDHKKIFVDFYH